MKFFIGCGVVLMAGLQVARESSMVMPAAQSLRGSSFDGHFEIEIQNATIGLQKRLDESLQQLEELRAEASKAALKPESPSTTSTSEFDPSDICSIFPATGASSATRLWSDHLPAILEASRNPKMADKETPEDPAKLREILEEILTPARMRRAVRHLPTFSHHIVKHVVGIIEKRLQDPRKHPPLRIAVFGGSVTIGRECIPGRISFFDCAWPKRFELLVNQFFGNDVVEVHNLGIGGTGSSTGTNRVKYWMYPKNKPISKIGPDVIVNSYSTNDSLPPWGKTYPEDDLITLVRERVRHALQEFVRESLQSKPCGVPPLVVHVDDYLGPQQPALLGELAYVSEMTELAKYYDTVGISYAEVVRDIVYRNLTDTTFFSGKHDVHYGRFAHQTIALSVGFAALELLINYCDDEHNSNKVTSGTPNANNTVKHGKEAVHLLTMEEMKNDRVYLPPPLTRDLLMENATAELDAALESSHHTYVEYDCGATTSEVDRSPCIISWISTPGNWNSRAIGKFMEEHKTNIEGWEAERKSEEGWSNKDGWIATQANATMGLRFPSVEKDIKTVSIYFLRSYGEKWRDSKARFTISRVPIDEEKGNVLSEFDISGFHADEDYHYSLTQSETIRLSETVAKGETLDIEVDLVGGSHFKIMGMMLCNK